MSVKKEKEYDYSSKPKVTVKELTGNDAKVLGRQTQLRRSKSVSPNRYETSALKTINSSWTPCIKRPTNDQIFKERAQLVFHWFDLWNDSQRKRFISQMLEDSEHSQHLHIRRWFDDRVPLQKLDFTQVLPRFLSLKIFSYLDPRSLSRASMVSWTWKGITEQDKLWMPKCKRYGWYLPYSPSELEIGAWKRHYIACTLNLDVCRPTKLGDPVYGRLGDGSETERRISAKQKKSLTQLTPDESKLLLDSRPPWMPTDRHPHDLQRARNALFAGYDPNDPSVPTSARLLHNSFGQVDPDKSAAISSNLAQAGGYGLERNSRKSQHRIPKTIENMPVLSGTQTLASCMDIERFSESRYRSLVEKPWEPPKKRILDQGPNLSGGACAYPMPWQRIVPENIEKMTGLIANYPGYSHPRVIFISSRVPAAEMLLDAVMFGVIPIMYEFEGTTLQTLLFRMESVLQGRLAQSIGIFGHHNNINELRLVQGSTLNLLDLDHPDIQDFAVTLSRHTVPGEQKGHIDVFVPLAAYGEGMEILVQLGILTGLEWTSPISIIGKFNYLHSEWSSQPEHVAPPSAYFEVNKLAVWSNTAHLVEEAIEKTKKTLAGYFDQLKRDIHKQITGQILFDTLGQTDIVGVRKIGEHLLAGLLDLSNTTNVDPLEHLGKYLLRVSGKPMDHSLLAVDSKSNLDKSEKEAENEERRHNKTDFNGLESLKTRRMEISGSRGSRGPMDLTPEVFADHPEKRTPIAQQILASEVAYLRCLEGVRDCLFVPLKRSLESNRAILSLHNIQTIFTDMLVFLELSRSLCADLKARLNDWSSSQCLGDVFLKFTGKLKAYTNFFLNYSTILTTLERAVETNPTFRAFLANREGQPEMRMLSLHELLLMPTRRLGEYVSLLSWFLSHTPPDHPDCVDLKEAIVTFGKMDQRIVHDKSRCECDRGLVQVQKMIINCPLLLEANRYFIIHEDVALLMPPASANSIDPEYRIYQHVEDCGVFLFSDAFITTRRLTRSFPYERVKEFSYIFQSSVALHRLSLYDIADSKFVHNALQVQTVKRKWVFSCVSKEAKQRLASTLEKAIRIALDNTD